MSLIAILVSVFGFLFVVRTLQVFRVRGLIHSRALTALGLSALTCFSLILFFAPGSAMTRAFDALVFSIGIPFVNFALERRKLALLKARVPLFIDRWILNLRLGSSVIAARDRALGEESTEFQTLLRPVFDDRLGANRRHLLLEPAVLRELDQIARAAHAALPRLEALRAYVRETSEFRRKSGQSVRQAAIQAVVMLCLLLALSVFTVRRYGWSRSGGYVTTAAALSTLGTLAMILLARKTRWKL